MALMAQLVRGTRQYKNGCYRKTILRLNFYIHNINTGMKREGKNERERETERHRDRDRERETERERERERE